MTDEVLDALQKAGAQQPDTSVAPQGGDEVLQAIQNAGAPPAEPPPQAAPVSAPVSAKPEAPIQSWSDVPSEALKHAVPSAIETGTAMVQPFIHPIQTYENLRDIGHGILQKAGVMSGDEDTGKVDAVMKYFADRYGGMSQLRNTIGHDPVGFATDAATLLTGGEGALARIPGILGKTAEAAGTVGRAIEPLAAPRAVGRALVPGMEDAKTLAEAGVPLTPGQMAGGYWKTAEDMASSIPVLGSWIQKARGRTIEGFNKAVGNQVLEPIGQTVGASTKAGHALVDEVESKLGAAYDKLTPTLKFNPDQQYWGEIASIYQNDYPWLSTEMQGKFDNLVGKQISPPGASFKTVESKLSSVVTKYLHSSDATQRELGEVANKVLIAARENLARTNPSQAAELNKINSAWAMYTRMRNAAARGQEGVFTPNQLLGAVKSGDRSVGKGSFAKGDALMQQFAETGQRVLPSKVPTSGTSERAAFMAALFGEGYLYSPHAAMGVAGAMLPYTKPGMSALNRAVFSPRPLSYLPRGTSYQLGKMDESQEDPYNQARRFFPP